MLLSLVEMNGLFFYDIVTTGLIVVELVETFMIIYISYFSVNLG